MKVLAQKVKFKHRKFGEEVMELLDFLLLFSDHSLAEENRTLENAYDEGDHGSDGYWDNWDKHGYFAKNWNSWHSNIHKEDDYYKAIRRSIIMSGGYVKVYRLTEYYLEAISSVLPDIERELPLLKVKRDFADRIRLNVFKAACQHAVMGIIDCLQDEILLDKQESKIYVQGDGGSWSILEKMLLSLQKCLVFDEVDKIFHSVRDFVHVYDIEAPSLKELILSIRAEDYVTLGRTKLN